MDDGILLVRGRREQVIAWVRRGTLPAYLVPHERWWGVVAAGGSRASAPYDQGVAVLAGHPVPARLRPAVGLFRAGERAVVVVSPPGWRRRTRWLSWTPGVGRHPLPGLPVARPEHLAEAAGLAHPAVAARVATLLADPGGDALDLLTDLATVLRLPFVEACTGTSGATLPGAELVGPAAASVRRFEKIVSEEKRLERELEEGL